MTNDTKMIIITSNEDLIREFSSKKNTNTLIIDLDNEKQTAIKKKSNNEIIDLALLAQLSELSSTEDQVYKRVLDLSDHYRSKPVKVQKKSIDLICTICSDRAIGFNYDALSCASCKAFFRRNAHHSRDQLRCLTGQNECSIKYDMRRKCQRCRLDRCFAMGMRKDFILSEEEKEMRRKRIEENRNMTSKTLSNSESTNPSSSANFSLNSISSQQTFDEIDLLLMDVEQDTKNIIDHENIDSNLIDKTLWSTIENTRLAFLSCFQDYDVPCSSIDLSDRISALLSWSQVVDGVALRFIKFFRQIDEFENLNADDRFILIKFNLLPLFPIIRCYKYNINESFFSNGEAEKLENRFRLFYLFRESFDIRDMLINGMLALVETTEQDPALLSLLLSVLIFSHGLSMNENEPSFNDPSAVHRAQIYYIELLWRYWLNKCGEKQTYKQFTKLLRIILKIQLAAKKLREFFHFQFTSLNTVDRVAPLVQSVLHIV